MKKYQEHEIDRVTLPVEFVPDNVRDLVLAADEAHSSSSLASGGTEGAAVRAAERP